MPRWVLKFMKILQIVSSVSDSYGGPVIGAKNLAKAFASHGHKISIYGTRKGLERVQEKLLHGYKLYEFPTQKPHRYYYSPQLSTFLKKTIKEYDIVHIHGLWTYPTFIVARICRVNNIPYIIRTCGMLDFWSISQKKIKKMLYFHLIEKRNIKMASFIQFSTDIEFTGSFYKELDSQKLRYIPNILDLENINKNNMQTNIQLINKKYILFFGRLCYKKGLDILIEAFNYLQKGPLYKNIYLVLVGPDDDNYFEHLKKKMSHFDVWDKIINIGMIYGEKRFNIVKNALFTCLPSRQENLGLSIMESLACGVPVLVSSSVDMAHVIESEYLGKISNIDSNHLFFIMKEMINSDNDRTEMGLKGKNFINNKFNKDIILDKYINMYKEAIEKKI